MKYCRYYPFPLIYHLIIKAKTIIFREKVAANLRYVILSIVFFLYLIPKQGYAQSDSIQNIILNTRITLSLKNAPVQKILDTLSTYPNIKFSYVNYDLPLQEKISLQTAEQPLKNLLDSILKPLGINYYVISKQIVLKKETPKKPSFTPSEMSKFSFSLVGSIGNAYRRLRSSNPTLVDDRNRDEKAIGNVALSGYVTYQYAPSIVFRTGISYFYTGENGSFSTNSLTIDSIIPGNNGNGNGSGNGNGNGNNVDTITSNTNGQDYEYKNKYRFLHLPLMVGYKFRKQRISVSVFAGIGIGLLLRATTNFPLDNTQYQTNSNSSQILSIYEKDPRTHSFRKATVSLPVMTEIEYLITKKIGISGGLGLHYFTSSIYHSSEEITYRPYYFNLSLGMTYHLVKGNP
jgi:hypothetical protein